MKLKEFIKSCDEATVLFVMDSSKINQCLFVTNCSPTAKPCVILRKKAHINVNDTVVEKFKAVGPDRINVYIDIGGIT